MFNLFRRDNRGRIRDRATTSHHGQPLSAPVIERGREVVSSPVKKASYYPSPSPEKQPLLNTQSRSSPLKKKRVAFSAKLISSKKMVQKTPRKSILKDTSRIVTISKQDQFLSSPTKSRLHNAPSKIDFWAPGQIAKLPQNQTTIHDELVSFKSLIHGGLVVLDPVDSSKKFEVYATFNLLLKDIHDPKKITILLAYMSDLSRLIRRDLISLQEIDVQNDPFSTRIHVQLTKLAMILISNTKLITYYWKQSEHNVEFPKWVIQNACITLLKPSVSKNLLMANLQLLKDQTLHTTIPFPLQEKILHATLNFKTFNNSTSLVLEKLNILRQLVQHSPVMMEKNCKNWISFVFKCVLDSTVSFQQKAMQTTVGVLLEACSQFLNSKSFHFEVTEILKSDVPEAYLDMKSSILVKQSIFTFITNKLTGLLSFDNCDLIMLVWMALTIAYFGNPDNLQFMSNSWLAICDKCFTLAGSGDNFKPQISAMKAWKGIIYVICNKESPIENNSMFRIFGQISSINRKDQNSDVANAINSLLTRFVFGINASKFTLTAKKSNYKTLIMTLIQLEDENAFGPLVITHYRELLIQILTSKNNGRNGTGNALFTVLQTEPLKVNTLDPLPAAALFESHGVYFKLFNKKIWNNDMVLSKVKLSVLSGMMSKVKIVLQGQGTESKIFETQQKKVLLEYQEFIPEYSNTKGIKDSAGKLEHFNRFTVLVKTNFGTRILTKDFAFYESLIVHAIANEVKATDVLKFIIQQNRTSEYFILDRVFSSFQIPSGAHNNPEYTKLMNFIVNNLESKIFVKNLTESERRSIVNIIVKIPEKSITLLINVMSVLLGHASDLTPFVDSLNLGTWSPNSVFNLINSLPLSKSITNTTREAFENLLTAKVQERLQVFDMTYTPPFFELLTKLKLSKYGNFKTFFYLSNNQYFYYHLIDPKRLYTSDVFPVMFSHFGTYLHKLKEKCESESLIPLRELDTIVCHGLNLCFSLNSSTPKDMDNSKLIDRFTKVYRLLFKVLKSMEASNYQQLRSVNEFISKKLDTGVLVILGDDLMKVSDKIMEASDQELKMRPPVSFDSTGEKTTQVIGSNPDQKETQVTQSSFEKQDIQDILSPCRVKDTHNFKPSLDEVKSQMIPFNSEDDETQIIAICAETVSGSDANLENKQLNQGFSSVANGKKSQNIASSPEIAAPLEADPRLEESTYEDHDENDDDCGSSEENAGEPSSDIHSDEVSIISREEFEFSDKDTLIVDTNTIGPRDIDIDSSPVKEVTITVEETQSDGSRSDGASKSGSIELMSIRGHNSLETGDSNWSLNVKSFYNQPEAQVDHNGAESDEEPENDPSLAINLPQPSPKPLEIDIPYSYTTLDSSPLRHKTRSSVIKRKALRQSPIPMSPPPVDSESSIVQDSIQVTKKRRREHSTNQDTESQLLGSPKRNKRAASNVEDSQTTFEVESGMKFAKISVKLDDLESEDLSSLTGAEMYKMETRLLQLMMKLRESHSKT